VSIAAHAFFQRDGADLHCRVPVSMVSAALGGEFEVPSIDGSKARVKVPGGTQSGRRFRLTGKGMPVLRSKQTGDMYVQVVVGLAKAHQRQRGLKPERLSSKTHPESAGFFGKVKEFLSFRVGQEFALDPRAVGFNGECHKLQSLCSVIQMSLPSAASREEFETEALFELKKGV
jgi:molecular chaperone DnaJ